MAVWIIMCSCIAENNICPKAFMRVVHILPSRSPEYGGPVAVAEEMAEGLRNLGVEVLIYPKIPNEDKNNHLSVKESWTEIRNFILTSDLVHIHGLWNFPASVAAHIARRENIPYIITPHGMLDRWSLGKSRLKKILFGLLIERKNVTSSSGLHFLNIEERSEAEEFGIKCPAFVIPNGVHPERYANLPDRVVLEERYPRFRGKILVLFLGRLHPKKGFDLLLPAFSQAVKCAPDLHLVIAGPDEGGYKADLHEMVIRNKLLGFVSFVGMVHGKSKLEVLGASDFFVLSSHQEGDSIAVKEAMASGLPVLITPACHFPQVTELNAGMVVRAEIDDLCDSIVYFATHLNERNLMGVNATKAIINQYTWSKIVGRLLLIYEDVINGTFSSVDWEN